MSLWCSQSSIEALLEYVQPSDKVKEKLKPYLSDDIPQSNYLTKIQHQLEEQYGINT